MPFWSSSASFWTTNQVKDTAVLGYAYPETQRWNFDSDEAYRASVNATVAQLYSSSVRARLTAGVSKASALGNLLVDDTYVDWNVQIQGASSTLPATFIAKFFLVGDFSSDIATDVGAWTVLMSSDHHVQVEKNKRASMLRMDMKGMVSLTESLLDHIVLGKLASLDASDVVPYLKDKLTWKVQAVSSPLGLDELPTDKYRVMGQLFLKVISMASSLRLSAQTSASPRIPTNSWCTVMRRQCTPRLHWGRVVAQGLQIDDDGYTNFHWGLSRP